MFHEVVQDITSHRQTKVGVVHDGPVVMNTAREIEQTILDDRVGKLGAIDHAEHQQGEHT